jgi:chitinase
MRLKEQHGHLRLILSIGGGAASHNFASVASSALTRDNFGRSAKGLVDASNFDGIDSLYHFSDISPYLCSVHVET